MIKNIFLSIILFLVGLQGVYAFDSSNSSVVANLSCNTGNGQSIYGYGSGGLGIGGGLFFCTNYTANQYWTTYVYDEIGTLKTSFNPPGTMPNYSTQYLRKIKSADWDIVQYKNTYSTFGTYITYFYDKRTKVLGGYVNYTYDATPNMYMSIYGMPVWEVNGSATKYTPQAYYSGATLLGYNVVTYTGAVSTEIATTDFYTEKTPEYLGKLYDIQQPVGTTVNLHYKGYYYYSGAFSYDESTVLVANDWIGGTILGKEIYKEAVGVNDDYFAISLRGSLNSQEYVRSYTMDNGVVYYYNDVFAIAYNPYNPEIGQYIINKGGSATMGIDGGTNGYLVLPKINFLGQNVPYWMYGATKIYSNSSTITQMQSGTTSSPINSSIPATNISNNITVNAGTGGLTEEEQGFWTSIWGGVTGTGGIGYIISDSLVGIGDKITGIFGTGAILEIVELSPPYGINFTGNANPFTINMQLATAQIGCGTITDVGYNFGGNMRVSPTEVSGYPTSPNGSQIIGDTWTFLWFTQEYLMGSWRNVGTFSSGSVDVADPIDNNGNFAYMKDKYGQTITTSNIITIDDSFTFSVNWKYDIKLFGYGLVDLFNNIIWIFTSGAKFGLNIALSTLSGIIDVVGMFWINYPTSGSVCYGGAIMNIGSTITETAITHTQNKGLLDFFFLLMVGGIGIKLFFNNK